MVFLESTLPLLGVAVGWLLHEVSSYFRTRREGRRPIAAALSNLLEIRHSALRVPKAMQMLGRVLGAPEAEWAKLQPLVLQAIPDVSDARARYAEAVERISEVDPLLGFELRRQELASSLDQIFQPFLAADPSSQDWYPGVKNLLLERLDDGLRRILLLLARRYSWWTWFRLWRGLRRPIELPEGFDDWLTEISALPGMQPLAENSEP